MRERGGKSGPGGFRSKALRCDPEALAPLAGWRNSLQIRADAGVRQVKSIGQGSHRLQADVVAALRSVDHRHAVLWPVGDGNLLGLSGDPKPGNSVLLDQT